MKWSAGVFVLIYGFSVAAAERLSTNSDLLNQIPPLAPPKPEIPPTFFEAHGTAVWVAAGVFTFFCGFIAFLLLRRRPAPVIPPAVLAREELASLRNQREDGILLSRTSQILRHYLAAAFQLPAVEMTTKEFCAAMGLQEQVQPDLSARVSSFLKLADDRKFNVASTPEPIGAVAEVSSLIDQAEARLAELKAIAERDNVLDRPSSKAPPPE